MIPYISHGPLIFWLYPPSAFAERPTFLSPPNGYLEHCCSLDSGPRRLESSGLSACFSLLGTSTIIPFIPGGWAASAGGFPTMTEKVAFLTKDLVPFGVSLYLLRQDVIRASLAKTHQSSDSTSDSTAASCQDFCSVIVIEGASGSQPLTVPCGTTNALHEDMHVNKKEQQLREG